MNMQEMNEGENFSMFPAVIDFYNKKKAAWAKEGLSEAQQLNTARQINQIMKMIQFGLENERHNYLYECLERYAQRFYTPKEQIRLFSAVVDLFAQGDKALQKMIWWYEKYPDVYEEKFSLNKAGYKVDKIRRVFQDVPLPHYSFMPLSKGEILSLTTSKSVWEKVQATQEFPQPDDTKNYQHWMTKTKAGQKYAYDKMVVRQTLGDLLLQAQNYQALEEKSHKKQGR